MTAFFIFRVNEEYLTLSTELREALENRDKKPQNRKTASFLEHAVESLLDVILEDMLSRVEMGDFARKTLVQVASLSTRTLGSLYSRLLAKTDNPSLRPLLAHFQSLEKEIDGVRFIALPLSDKHYQDAKNCLQAFDDNELKLAQDRIIKFTEDFIPLLLTLFIKDVSRLLETGMITRKLINVAEATIEKSALLAAPKVVSSLDASNTRTYQAFMKDHFYEEE